MNYVRTKRRQAKIDLIPMIDIIFYLVIFFMLFTSLRTVESGIDVDLPKAEAATNLKPASVEVTISKSGIMYYEGKTVDKTTLTSKLSDVIKRNSDTIIIIKADKEVKYERVVEVMDIVGTVGGKKFSFAVDKVSR